MRRNKLQTYEQNKLFAQARKQVTRYIAQTGTGQTTVAFKIITIFFRSLNKIKSKNDNPVQVYISTFVLFSNCRVTHNLKRNDIRSASPRRDIRRIFRK